MARQKAVQKEKSNTKDNPKPGKQKRSKEQLDAVKRAGMAIACIAGAITTLSSIRWDGCIADDAGTAVCSHAWHAWK